VLGWDAKPGEVPDRQVVRRASIEHLGAWGEPAVVAEARRRFARFVADRSTLDPDAQSIVLTVVAQNADQAAFDQLHAIAKSSQDETQARRYYGALASVEDPKLVEQALEIMMSSELPPQMAGQRAPLIVAMAQNNPPVVWRFYKAHVDELNANRSEFSRALAIANVPQSFWNAAPLDELEAFVKAKGQPAPAQFVARAMERARFNLALKARLVPATDAYVKTMRRPL
jgi:aminopeptidase N